jgi:hypothetical protein
MISNEDINLLLAGKAEYYECDQCGYIVVSAVKPHGCPECDVLYTLVSSEHAHLVSDVREAHRAHLVVVK